MIRGTRGIHKYLEFVLTMETHEVLGHVSSGFRLDGKVGVG